MPQHAVLLLSDIVDSTRLIQTLGDNAYATLFDAHDVAVRQLAAVHRGRELSRSDGVLMRFHSVDGAASFAIAYHHALAALHPDLRVRIGIHAGPLDLRDVDDLRASPASVLPGLTIPVTARVAALSSGGQTLLSTAAREALVASKHRVVSHGHWRLKGVTDPIEVFEIGDATAVFVPPRDEAKAYRVVQRHGLWLPRREIAHTLPAERDRFVGRNVALEALASSIDDDARLVTVVGPGGGGKTRLVQRFGWRWLGDFEGGVWYCDLAQATTCDGLVSAVAQGLALQLGASPPIEQIASAIAGRGRCLVILDNFEQLLRFARDTLERWLDAAADAQFIVTSRTVLGLPGETVYRLASMEPGESADLFVERAGAAVGASDRGSVALRKLGADADAVAAIVRMLDGIPLAIELASARLRIMDLPTLVERMRQRFQVLAAGNRTGRHATLRATLDWSWELLSRAERLALAQASVFEGGFDLHAFEHVIDLGSGGDQAPIDVLQALVEQSLVQQTGLSRFTLLVSVQEYAAEHLASPNRLDGYGPAARDAALVRHARHFASIDERTSNLSSGIDLDNLVSAIRRSIALDLPDVASRALVNAWAGLKQSGPYRMGSQLAGELLASSSSLSPVDMARMNFVAGSAAQDVGDVAVADARFAEGLRAAGRAGAVANFEAARILRARGELEITTGRWEAAAATLADALQRSRELGDETLQSETLNMLGTLAQTTGENHTALKYFGDALALAKRLDDERWTGALLGNLATAHYGLGDHAAAEARYLQSLSIAERFGDRRWIGNMRANLGLVLCERGQHDAAFGELQTALAISRHLGHTRLELVVMWNLGITRAAQGQMAEALADLASARDIAHRLDDRQAMRLLDEQIIDFEAKTG